MAEVDRPQSELEIYERLTAGFTGSLVRHARQIPEDKWNWSFSERTPTAREICEHAFMWLWCDRQQMTEDDISRHRPVPNLPSDRDSMIRLLEDEAQVWRRLVRSFSSESLLEEREAFEGDGRNVRWFLYHMGQHLVYKLGQLSMLYYQLGLDGAERYDAPHPNQIYEFSDVPAWPSPRRE